MSDIPEYPGHDLSSSSRMGDPMNFQVRVLVNVKPFPTKGMLLEVVSGPLPIWGGSRTDVLVQNPFVRRDWWHYQGFQRFWGWLLHQWSGPPKNRLHLTSNEYEFLDPLEEIALLELS